MLEGLLPHTAEIRRRRSETSQAATARADRFGQDPDQNPTASKARAATAKFPCRVTRGKGGRAEGERMADVFEVTYTLFAGPDADIHESDSVRVTGRGGETIVDDAKVMVRNVVYDAGQAHHIECMLMSQRGPQP